MIPNDQKTFLKNSISNWDHDSCISTLVIHAAKNYAGLLAGVNFDAKKSWKIDNVMLCYAIKILLNMQEIPLK